MKVTEGVDSPAQGATTKVEWMNDESGTDVRNITWECSFYSRNGVDGEDVSWWVSDHL